MKVLNLNVDIENVKKLCEQIKECNAQIILLESNLDRFGMLIDQEETKERG